MTKLSKILIAAFAVVAFTASTASAAFTYTSFLKVGSKGASVMSLQQTLNMTSCQVAAAGKAGSPGMETSYFGPATTAAVKCFQSANGLTADGLVGKNTGAALAAVTGGSGLPAGCTSTSGFSSTTGMPCNGGSGTVVLPPGCTTTAGYSPVTGQSCASGNTGSQTGPVSASLSATTPSAGYIIDGQATAGLLDVNFTGNGTVNSVTLTRSGISDQNTLSNVYLYDGATRLTDGYSFNSTGQITINNLNLAVNGTKTISVKADVPIGAANSASTIAVALTNFTSGATVNNVNIQGNLMNTASGSSLATAVLSSNTAPGGTVNAGTTAYTFWSAPLQVNTRAVWLKSAAFRMIGSAPADAISNIRLYVDGVDAGVIATTSMINGSNYAMFDFMASPKSLSTGSHTVDIRGTVEKGSSRTVQFSLQQAADLMITDPQVGVNIAVSGVIPNSAASVSINAGSLTINNDPVFNAMSNITGGASNVVIAKYKLHAYGEDVKVSSLVVDPEFTVAPTTSPACTNNTDCSLDDVTLYFNGSQVGTQQDWTGLAATNLTYNLGSQLIVPAGTDSYLEVRANVRTSAGANYTAGAIRANLIVGSSNAQGQNSFTSINTPAITGTTLTIQTGLLAASKNSGYANQSVTPNTAGVKIGSYVLQNQSSSESVRVTSLSFGLAFGAPQVLANYGALRTSETSGSGGTPIQPAATNTFSVDFTLAPGATKSIDLFADTGSITTGTVIATLGTTSIGVSSNVSQSITGVTGQTITVGAGVVNTTPTLVTASSTSAQYIAAGMGGAVDATKATYNFVSAGGSATISELKFTITGGTNPVTSVKVNGVSAPVVSGVAYLTGLNLEVPSGGSGLTQDVFISYSEVGTNGETPGSSSTVSLTEVKYSSGGTTTTFNPAVPAPTMVMVGSKPTLAVNGTQATGLILGAENKIGEVTVTADAKGNIKINDIQFAVGSSNITTFAIGSPRIADGTTTITGSSCGANVSVTTTVFCEFAPSGTASGVQITNTEINTDFDGYTIAAGTSKTFSLYGTVTGTITTGGGTTTVSTSVNSGGFNWDDTSTNGGAGSFGLTGSLIYNFPTGSYSIRQ